MPRYPSIIQAARTAVEAAAVIALLIVACAAIGAASLVR